MFLKSFGLNLGKTRIGIQDENDLISYKSECQIQCAVLYLNFESRQPGPISLLLIFLNFLFLFNYRILDLFSWLCLIYLFIQINEKTW